MKTLLFNIIFLGGSLLGSSVLVAQGLSYKNLSVCKHDYAELLEQENKWASVDEFPQGVYLARSVTQSFEKAGDQYYTYQPLLNEKQNPEICFQGKAAAKLKTQSFVPTMIDRTKENKWGHTFWSFSADLDKTTGAVDSTRSLIPNEDYKKALENQGFKVSSMQKSHGEYVIKLERSIASWNEKIIITYDQF